MYKCEKQFGLSFMNQLKRCSMDCMRIESASTISGCPDLFVQGQGLDFFIELKNMPTVSIYTANINVPYRPGQIAWATRYRLAHTCIEKQFDEQYVIAVARNSFTAIGAKDGIILIPMTAQITSSIVNIEDRICIPAKDVLHTDWFNVLKQRSFELTLFPCDDWTIHDYADHMLQAYISKMYDYSIEDLDYPLAEEWFDFKTSNCDQYKNIDTATQKLIEAINNMAKETAICIVDNYIRNILPRGGKA